MTCPAPGAPIAAPSYTLVLRRVVNARRLRLAIDPRDGTVRLTVPPRFSEARARRWADEHRDWVEAQLARVPAPQPIVPGAAIPWRGTAVTIDWAAAHRRQPAIDGGRLMVGGPRELLARRVLRWLRAEALRVLEAETRALAAMAGITVGRVAVGDQRGRWGSCSSAGDIRYSWRLILAPPAVLSSTVAHEVAHRLHMDHGAAFHAAERRLLGWDPADERAWLRAHGAALHRVGRDAAVSTG